MQPSGSVHDQQIGFLGLGSLYAVKHYTGGVGPFLVAHDGTTGPFRPDLQLVGSSGAEGISRAKNDGAAKALKTQGQLADGGGFANAVHTHHQNDHGPFQYGLFDFQHSYQNFLQSGFGLSRRAELLRLHGLPQLFQRFLGTCSAHVRKDHGVQQGVVKILVNGCIRLQCILRHRGDLFAALAHTLPKPGEKAFLFTHDAASFAP